MDILFNSTFLKSLLADGWGVLVIGGLLLIGWFVVKGTGDVGNDGYAQDDDTSSNKEK